jgi:hypothetical protein
MIVYEGHDISLWEYMEWKFSNRDGMIMLGALVVLAAFYPLFGYMRKRVTNCNLKDDNIRIQNAMHTYGFRYVGEKDGAQIYRAAGILQRLILRFDDKIELRQMSDGVEFYGIRSRVARIAFQLEAYLNNKRYESNETDNK